MLSLNNMVAVDIGSSAVKVVELSGGTNKKLANIGIESIPNGAVIDGSLQNVDAIADVLKRIFKRMKIPRWKRIALSVGGNSVIIKRVRVDVAKDSTFEEQVFYQAEQAFQIDLSELYFDSVPLSDPKISEGQIDTVIVGARRDLIDGYISLIKSTGKQIGTVECSAISSYNMFEHNFGVIEGLVGIINIGASGCQVTLVNRGAFLFTRDVHIGGEAYTKKIAEIVGVDFDSAESLKIAAGSGQEAKAAEVSQAINAMNESLVSEIKTTIDYFMQSPEAPQDAIGLNYIFLAGGAARTLGLDASLAAGLQVPVQVINPFQRIDVNQKKFGLEYMTNNGHMFGIAVGLGLRKKGDRA